MKFFHKRIKPVGQIIVNTALPLSSLAKDLNQLTDDTNKTIAVQRKAADQAKIAVDDMSNSVIAEASSANEASSAANDSNTAADRGQQTVGVTVNNIRQLATNVQEASELFCDAFNHIQHSADLVRICFQFQNDF